MREMNVFAAVLIVDVIPVHTVAFEPEDTEDGFLDFSCSSNHQAIHATSR
jgi:hypothetical protein